MPRNVDDYQLTSQILSQPAEVERVLSAPAPIAEAAGIIAAASRVYTVGTGTSTNAARAGAAMLRAAGRDAVEWASFDFALYGPALDSSTAVIVFSHSGRKQYSRQSMERAMAAGAPLIWVAGSEAEPGEATITLPTVSRETSAAYTVSHLTAMALTARLADAIAPGCVGDIATLPVSLRAAVDTRAAIHDLTGQLHGFATLFGIAGGLHEPSAHELAIKVNEAARLYCRGYAVEQFLHGPQAQVQARDAFVFFAGPGAALERTLAAAQFALDVGAPVAWLAPGPGPQGSVHIPVPAVHEQLAPIVEIVPGQWLAAHLAALENVDADNFRRDDPAFLEAYGRYKL